MVSYDFPRSFGFANLMAGTSYDLVHSLLPLFLGPFWRSLAWAQVGEDKSLQRFPKAISLPYVVHRRLSCFFWSFMACQNFWNGGLVWISTTGLKLFLFSWRWFSCLRLLLPRFSRRPIKLFQRGRQRPGLVLVWLKSDFWRIIFPLAFQVALPNITTHILNLMRDAALAYTIGFVDVMGRGNLLISRNLGNYSLETYTAVALLYWGLP